MDLKNRIIGRFSKEDPPVLPRANGDEGASHRLPVEFVPPLVVRALSEPERDWLQRIHQKLMGMIDLSQIARLDEKQARNQIRELAERIMDEQAAPLNASARQFLAKCIEDEILGLGPIEPLLVDPSIADILVNGCGKIYVERYGKLELTPLRFQSDAHLLNIIDRIVSSVGRRIDESSPMVDARLKDGSRVNAIIPPLAIDGPTLSIRRFTLDRLRMEDLIELGTCTQTMAALLIGIVKAKLNVLISGGTGSGKTTLLNVLTGFISANERIITIEDSAELQLQQPHVVRLETRPPNIEGKGEVRQRDLVRNSLRMRPDRIIVGEVRSDEAFDMLQAMNTGHDGSLTTVHANSSRDALGRLENMVAMTGLDLPARMVRSQIASAINVVLQLARLEDGKRKLISIQEIQGMEGDIITMSEIFNFQRRGIDEYGNVLGSFKATGIVPKFHDKLQKRGIDLSFDLFDPDRGG
ncbi:MAG: CpaF family protein [Methylococcaceae bacterium]|nr:CpaF family protein [Methylococcaceae bacterium]